MTTNSAVSDDAYMVHRVQIGPKTGTVTLDFYRDPRTRLISVEVIKEGNKRLGWLCKNVKIETIAKKFEDAWLSAIV